jgi:hypothetical protein
MATVSSVALTQPASDPNINEGGTFTHGGQITKALHGGLDYNMHWQWDQGTGTWTDITGSGGLSTADTNPQNNLGDEAEHTITVTGNTAGSYEVRIRTVDNNDGGAEDLSGTQTVTVNAAATRRVMVVS